MVVVIAHNDWCWPPTRSDAMVVVCRVPFAVVFIPLKSMIISSGNGVQMETTLPIMLEILLEAEEL